MPIPVPALENHIQGFLNSLREQNTYASSTRSAYAADLKRLRAFLHGQLKGQPVGAAELTPESVQAFLASEQGQGFRPNTLMRRRASLRQFVLYLSEQNQPVETGELLGLLAMNQVSQAKQAAPQTLDQQDIERMLAVIQTARQPYARRDHAILALLLETGLSVSDLIALDTGDIDLENSRARLRTLKNAPKKETWVPLGSAYQPVKIYLEAGRPEFNLPARENGLFVSQMGARMSRQNVWQILIHLGSAAGLPLAPTPRLLRHTAVQRLLQAGAPTAHIQALLGHRNSVSTQALLRRLRSSQALMKVPQP